jgi:serine/threonine protein kinase
MLHDSSRTEALFLAAAEIVGPQDRAAFLTRECGDDPALRARVEALLASNDEAGEFLQPAAPSPDMEFELAGLKPEEGGERIGQYQLLQQIGEGGFGVVWMAEQEQPVRRRVALKIIKLGMDTKEVIARFEQEQQALAMMDHPNIAKVFDAGATPFGRPYFVMELVRGIKITDYCDQASLPTADRLQLFITVCQAVQHAHQKGIIHRDLKPSNILVTLRDGVPVPKVIDFGVAKALQGRLTDRTLFTQLEQMIGTPLYMSPEQAELSGLDIDTRSDIYSLGVLLYELLTGRTPVDSETLHRAGLDEIRRIIREEEPPRPSMALQTMAAVTRTVVAGRRHVEPPRLVGLLRGDLDWIVMKALEKDRARRYDTATALGEDLRRHLVFEPVTARPPSRLYSFRRMARRNKVAFAAGTVIGLALLVGAVVSTWQEARARRGEDRANAALNDLRATAPAFAALARALTAKENFAEAIEKLNYAIKLRPDAPEYLLAKADLLESLFRFAEAAPIYRAALRLDLGDARAQARVGLCDQLDAESAAQEKLSRESLAQLLTAMTHEHRSAAEMMPVRRLIGVEKKALFDYWLERLKDLPIPLERRLEQRLSMQDDGSLELDLQHSHLIDASPLAGMPVAILGLDYCYEFKDLRPISGLPLRSLNIHSTKVSDLSPISSMQTLKALGLDWCQVRDLSSLRGLTLNWLSLSVTGVTDLAPLQGMRLEVLHIDKTPVSDLKPLKGMLLKNLRCNNIPAIDFSPLEGAPLEVLNLDGTRVGDLSFLHGMPLKTLTLSGCKSCRHFQTVAQLDRLEQLVLPENFQSLPKEELSAIESLRKHPTLREIYAGAIGGSKEAFFEQWDRH